MKQTDRTDGGRANQSELEPGPARASEARGERPEDDATPVFRGTDLRIPDATEQLARVLLRGGAEPRPPAQTPAGG